ncbi:MAG: response regulator [Methanobacterium sp.]
MTIKILVVEDENLIALDLGYTLEELGFNFIGAACEGEEAIKKAKELKPDLILMDIKLNGEMDGIETAEEINSLLGIPIIYLSANNDSDTRKKIKSTNNFGLLSKPVDNLELKSTIEETIYKT